MKKLGDIVAELFPEVEEVPLRGREQERLAALEGAARLLASLPVSLASVASPHDRVLLGQAAALRQQAAETLSFLSEHARAELLSGIERSLAKWDQAGDLQLLPEGGRKAALMLHTACDQALSAVLSAHRRGPGEVALLGAIAEAGVAIDATCAILRAVELRFVILLRERLSTALGRTDREALLPSGVPFFDLGGALSAVAAAFFGEGAQDGVIT